jgi:hypothetical protein
MAKKVATLKKKRPKAKALCYIDGSGHVRCRKGGRKKGKGTILIKNAVSKELVKKRKAGKIGLFLRGKVGKTLSVWQGKGWKAALKIKKRKTKKRKTKKRTLKKATKKKGRRRKRGRPKLSAHKRKGKRCPTFRKAKTIKSAKRCVLAGKRRTSLADRKVYNAAVRRIRRSKGGISWLKTRKITLIKGKGL